MLEGSPVVNWLEIWGVLQKCQLFYYCSEKKRGKKKACQTKEESNKICLFKITCNCLRERKTVQKALMCIARRDYSA